MKSYSDKSTQSLLFFGDYSQHLIPIFQTHKKYNKEFRIGDIFNKKFPSGEWYCQYKENIREKDVFIVQSICNPANEALMQILIMADAARRASAARITAVIPYFGYARQDRKDKSRTPISAKLIMDLLESAGIDRIITMDLHSPQIGGFTNLPFDHLMFEPILAEYLQDYYNIDKHKSEFVVMAPDVGAVKRIERYSRILNLSLGFISKRRINDTQVELQHIVGDVKDKNVFIIDDITESVGTLIEAATKCKEQGALKVICAVTHGCLSEIGTQRLVSAMKNSIFDHFICSNSINIYYNNNNKELYNIDNITVLDISSMFGDAIECIHKGKSISELFVHLH